MNQGLNSAAFMLLNSSGWVLFFALIVAPAAKCFPPLCPLTEKSHTALNAGARSGSCTASLASLFPLEGLALGPLTAKVKMFESP